MIKLLRQMLGIGENFCVDCRYFRAETICGHRCTHDYRKLKFVDQVTGERRSYDNDCTSVKQRYCRLHEPMKTKIDIII